MDNADQQKREKTDKAEEAETLTALDEAFAELEQGEGRPTDEALPALRERLQIYRSPR